VPFGSVVPVDSVASREYDPSVRQQRRNQLARKTVFVSDFSAKEIGDEKQSATITVKFGDGRRGIIIADAHVDDTIVQEVAKAGRQQARRGRPKASSG
jgi:hypothetical protein